MVRIVVLEDDTVVRKTVVKLLLDRGHGVQSFATIKAARAYLDRTQPDIFIGDVDLPDGCGLAMIELVKERWGDSVPTIVFSSRRGEDDFARAFAAGATDYVVKPFSTAELLARIQVHVERAQRTRPSLSANLPEKNGLAFGRYKIDRTIGRGSYGFVVVAQDMERGGAKVALKVLAPDPRERDEARLRFVRETYTLASVKSPHVTAIHEVGAERGWNYFSMELVGGESLAARVVREGPLCEADARQLARGLIEALAAVAEAGLVHRDVKPANVILRDGRIDDPVLVDFGMAKRPLDRGVTAADMFVGTPGYMSPEVIVGSPVDARADLFSCGLTLRYALTGEETFPELQGIELLKAIAHGTVPSVDRPLSSSFRQFLEKLHAREILRRPISPAVALEMLDLATAAPPMPPDSGAPVRMPSEVKTQVVSQVSFIEERKTKAEAA